MKRITSLVLAVGIACFAIKSVTADPPVEGGGCSQGCHIDQFWKVGSQCVKADVVTCCVVSWAVATGGTYGVTGGPYVDHYAYSEDSCTAICVDKLDSVAWPFAVTGLSRVLWGSYPECRCVP